MALMVHMHKRLAREARGNGIASPRLAVRPPVR
jgi:hypothetical protein